MPGSTASAATGINASGQIVGIYSAGSLRNHGFLLSGGNYTTLDPPGSRETQPRGVNVSSQIVGDYFDASGEHGFLLSGGSYTTLDVPGSNRTAAWGINDSGQIVGSYTDASGEHGFLLSGGSYTTLDPPGSTTTRAFGINDSGHIVGQYFDAGGEHGFLATLAKVLNTELSGEVKAGTTVFDPTPVPEGLAGTFAFTAEFCNTGSRQLKALASETSVLTTGNVLRNRDNGTPPAVGSLLTFSANHGYTDMRLDPGECVEVLYQIGLEKREPFQFFVDVVGVP